MDKRNMLDRLFPVKYHFYAMIDQQSSLNSRAIDILCRWLKSGSDADSQALLDCVRQSDEVRKQLEKSLIEAFTTPFDRADIYSLSSGMDKVIQYTKSTLLSMQAYEIQADDTIRRMVEKLQEGAAVFSESTRDLEHNPSQSEADFTRMRDTHTSIEQLYRDGMAAVFRGSDPMYALRQREVYHHVKDASSNLDDTVEILHRIVVRLT